MKCGICQKKSTPNKIQPSVVTRLSPAAQPMSGGQALAQQLVREGVRHVFGVSGHSIFDITDAIYQEPGIEFVPSQIEVASGYMTNGYARATGKVGWLSAQQHYAQNIGETATHVIFVELKEGTHAAGEAVGPIGPAVSR